MTRSAVKALKRIRVCHLAMGDLWAGAEVQLASLLASLAKVPDVEISAILLNEGRLAGELRDCGIQVQVIPESQHNSLSVAMQLWAYFGRHEIDILHTHKYKDNILGALASVYGGPRYRIKTIHGMPEPHVGVQAINRKLYHILDSSINRWLVHRILAVSFDLRRQLIQRFGPEKVICIQNGIDLTKIQVTRCTKERRKELHLGGQDFVIGTMGRLTPGKGLECFLKAAQIISHQRPNVKFLVVGDGPLRGSLQVRAREYDLERNVLFLGHRDDNYAILELMEIFVLPSFSEGIPMVLLEALALARPVVATQVGGIPEVVEHGISGLLVNAGSEDELAESCLALIDDRRWAQQLGLAGQRRIEERFSARHMAEKAAEVYRMLVCSGAKA